MLKKSDKYNGNAFNRINEEIEDLTVIADYLQYNFNRLETIASVIELSGFKEIDIKWVQNIDILS